MKRKTALLIAAIFCLSLAACGKMPGPEQGPQSSHMEAAGTESSGGTQQGIALVGPWHLDREKNDLVAFANSLEPFPGYGEWGASMEIRSDGQMSWYIGAAGGCGTYTIEDDRLCASLVNDMDQKDMVIDFRILVENEKALLEMDYQDVTVYWVYGDQGDTPAAGNDESQGGDVHPGEDVVEIVNLRGDKTIIYKSADGTYMDNMKHRFTYNGVDTWTDENGVEWNEVAND